MTYMPGDIERQIRDLEMERYKIDIKKAEFMKIQEQQKIYEREMQTNYDNLKSELKRLGIEAHVDGTRILFDSQEDMNLFKMSSDYAEYLWVKLELNNRHL